MTADCCRVCCSGTEPDRCQQHLDDSIERRRMEESLLKLDAVQKVLVLVVNVLMSQGERVKDSKEKQKVPGWSSEEMKEGPNMAEDTEKMKGWRRRLRRKSWTSTKSKRARKGLPKAEATHWNEKECEEAGSTRGCWARLFSLFREYNLQRRQSNQEEQTKDEEMKQQQRMANMKDLIKKIKTKEAWLPKTVGGSRSCLRRIVRKHGPTEDGRIPC